MKNKLNTIIQEVKAFLGFKEDIDLAKTKALGEGVKPFF